MKRTLNPTTTTTTTTTATTLEEEQRQQHLQLPNQKQKHGKIIIDNMTVHGIVGAKPRERDKPQALHLSITLWTNFSEAAKTDDLTTTVDYSVLSRQVYQFVTEKKAKLLEHLVESLAMFLFEFDQRIDKCKILIKKPSAIPLASNASVEIKRSRCDYPNLIVLSARPDLLSQKSTLEDKIILAFGTNLGDRVKNIETALHKLKAFSEIVKVSFLYQTNPKYVTDQPLFLNCVCQIKTKLEPPQLLTEIKQIEEAMGREFKTIRNGPRIIDIDILFYSSIQQTSSTLVIPHPQLHERDFVIGPLMDIDPHLVHPVLKKTVKQMWLDLNKCPEIVSVCPATIKGKEKLFFINPSEKTYVMGILNLTPDSFSDGGTLFPFNPTTFLPYIKDIISRSAVDILDIGGESTRPGADPVPIDQELQRVLPIIQCLRDDPHFDNILISIDTWKSEVAQRAIEAGANLINDVSGGRDPDIFKVAVKYSAPIVIMHTRGTPQEMANLTNYPPEDNGAFLTALAKELQPSIDRALSEGIFPWRIITDPGIGFAKQTQHNLQILRNLRQWKILTGNYPVLVGPSRKRFISEICGDLKPTERAWGTAATVAAAVEGQVTIVRVHDIIEMSQLVKVSDAIWKPKSTPS